MAGFCHWWQNSLMVYCENGWGITSSCNPFLIALHSKNTRNKKNLSKNHWCKGSYSNWCTITIIIKLTLLVLQRIRISGFAILVWLPSAIRATFPENVEQLLWRTILEGLHFKQAANYSGVSFQCQFVGTAVRWSMILLIPMSARHLDQWRIWSHKSSILFAKLAISDQ